MDFLEKPKKIVGLIVVCEEGIEDQILKEWNKKLV
jgi:hypothetical protein